MKQSEFKKMNARSLKPVEITVTNYTCKNIKKGGGGCPCCYYCDKCGRSGCYNQLGGPNVKYETIQCDLEEG